MLNILTILEKFWVLDVQNLKGHTINASVDGRE